MLGHVLPKKKKYTTRHLVYAHLFQPVTRDVATIHLWDVKRKNFRSKREAGSTSNYVFKANFTIFHGNS